MQRYSGKLLATLTAIVMIVGSFHPTVVRAAAGEGTATIAVGTGTLTNANTATYGSDLPTVEVTVGTLAYLKIKLTVGASHIAAAQNNVTVQIPTNLFPTNGFTTNEQAAITDVNASGEFFISYTDVSSTTNNAAISFAASAAANTGLVTIQADQQMDATDIIILTVAVNDLNNYKAATALTISTDDTGGTPSAIAVQPSVSTAAADAAASVTLSTNNYVGAVGTTTVTLTLPFALDADDTIDITFPASINVAGVASAVTGTLESSDSITCAVASQVVTCTTSAATNASGTIIMTGIKAAYAATTDITVFEVENEGNATNDIATDTVVAMTDTLSSDSEGEDDSSSSSADTYDIEVTVPEASAAYMPGDDVEITWNTSGGSASAGFVSLYYSVDGGTTLVTIEENTVNDSTYNWTVPDITEQSVIIYAESTDLLDVLATDESGAFSIGGDAAAEEEEDAEDVDTSEDSEELLPDGTYMMGESWSTVYYVHDGMRHPFLDSQTFFTYADDFDDVIEVEDGYLANYTIGTPMLPKAGTVLVKVQSVNSVYVLEADNTLRWITSEDLAEELYGDDWADYVIDVPVTAWGHFNHGDDVDSASEVEVDLDSMQTRDELNSK